MTRDEAIVIERRAQAAPSIVYQHLTDSAAWAKWQGVDAEIHAEPGGIFRMTMGNGMLARGEFVELVPDRRVVFTWGWVDHPGCPPGSSTVEVDLIGDDDGTIIRLMHRGLAPEERPVHTMGWHHYTDRLATVVSGGDPGPDPGPG